jgi:hypothetical protein
VDPLKMRLRQCKVGDHIRADRREFGKRKRDLAVGRMRAASGSFPGHKWALESIYYSAVPV